MKSYLFTTDNDRGGVMLCDIDDFDEAVEYLVDRFDGVVKVEAGEEVWQLDTSAQPAPASDQVDVVDSSQPQAVTGDTDLFA